MLKKILLGVVIVVAGFLLVASMQPADFRISRSATIAATPAAIFPHVNTMQQWNDWSPWAKLDPHATNSFEGPASGVGATMSWAGNNDVGAGTMTIEESQPNQRIQLRLDFLRPMVATNHAEFTFTPAAQGTTVTWTMTGTNGLFGKAMGLLFNCDKMVGGQFEQGLANLATVAAAPVTP